MIIICFSFFGNQVKITAEGDHCADHLYNSSLRLKKIREMNNLLLDKNTDKFKIIYGWCDEHHSQKFRKGRNTNFAF